MVWEEWTPHTYGKDDHQSTRGWQGWKSLCRFEARVGRIAQ